MAAKNLQNSKGRLTVMLDGLDPNSPEFRAALFRIGTLIRNEAVSIITSEGAVDEGTLRASIAFKIENSRDLSRVIVGAFGIKYARMVEYGGAFTDQMRKAMFASFRERGKPHRESKSVIKGGWYHARPFIGPAVKNTSTDVEDILRDLIKKQGKILR